MARKRHTDGFYEAFPEELSGLRILVSNDDGINAPGLKVLEKIAKTLSKDVWVVAPESEQSGVAHSLTLHEPLRVRRLAPKRFAVNGTPTDCALLAIKTVVPKRKPIDLVLSGVNPGENLADDITYSGTVAATIEGTLLQVPSIALSMTRGFGEPVKWHTVEQLAPELIRKILRSKWQRNTLININFPDLEPEEVKGVKLTPMGLRVINDHVEARVDPFGRTYYWVGTPHGDHGANHDVDLTWNSRGYITVTPLHLDMTNYKALESMRGELEAG